MICTRCQGTGFLNFDQVDVETIAEYEHTNDVQVILKWIAARDVIVARGCSCSEMRFPPCSACTEAHDVAVCDCCGDGEDWPFMPGQHSGSESRINCY